MQSPVAKRAGGCLAGPNPPEGKVPNAQSCTSAKKKGI
jgi:hypothetical protein